ncbi:RraA family protein [Geminicoccus roseus]|uniref:RraA family protein n=1 Tax=Geminicoccus roseus TaxID=404900 RepID=UPI0003FFA573|nr:dimethylmenaquinone methyltransferase [Geminicoccus roseus]
MSVTIHAPAAGEMSSAEIERWRSVPVAVAVDVGQALGQIDPAIRPLRPAGQQPRLFGRAVAATCAPPDFGAVLWAVDQVQAGDVLVIAAGGHAETAMIGEILGGQLRRRGAVGLICDGAIRDVGTLAAWADFPVFSRHVTPRGPSSAERGSVNAPVVVGGCLVHPGDLIIGDDDGLIALRPEAVRSRIGDAEGKLRLESEWEASLAGGRSIRDTFNLADPAKAPAVP